MERVRLTQGDGEGGGMPSLPRTPGAGPRKGHERQPVNLELASSEKLP